MEGRSFLFDDVNSLRHAARIASFREAGFKVVLEAVESRNQPCSALRHHLRALVVEHSAMLNGVDTGAYGSFNADGAFGVSHDFAACAMSDFNRAGHLLVTQFLYAVVADRVHDAACGHELDPISAILDVAAHDAVHIVNGIDSIGLLKAGLVRRKQVTVAL